MVKILNIIIYFFILIIVSTLVLAVPPLPTEFYGAVQSFNNPALTGSVISAYDSDNNLCGSFTISKLGYFGVLTCRGEDAYANITGGSENEIITFKINTFPASVLLNGNLSGLGFVTWNEGTFKEITLVAPPLVCGDAYCDLYETCNSCSVDCGSCPVNPPDDTGGGGSGGGGSGGGGSAGGSTTPIAGVTLEREQEQIDCDESWICGEWQDCTPDNIQFRDCVDLNNCGTNDTAPLFFQDCIYVGEEYVPDDYNRTEESPREPPQLEFPTIITLCEDRLSFFSLPSLIFILLVIFILSIAYLRLKLKIMGIDKDKELEELKKLELKYILERRTYIFFVVMIVLAIIVYFYHYFFFLCKDRYIQHLWLLIAFVIMSPVIVHLILESTKFSQDKKNKLIKMFNDTHYQHVRQMINIANEELLRAETSIINDVFNLESKAEFHDYLTKNVAIVKIYKDMTKLYGLYKRGKNPVAIEKDLLENIKKLDSDEQFQKAASEHPELNSMKENLKTLYSAYEAKQELYDELQKIRDEYNKPPVIGSENKS